MIEFIRLCAGFLVAVFKSRAGFQAENLALRHNCACISGASRGQRCSLVIALSGAFWPGLGLDGRML